jgi:hypothetical protein
MHTKFAPGNLRGRERLGNLSEVERMQVRHDFRKFRVIAVVGGV